MPNVLQKIVLICKIDKIFYNIHSDSIITLPFIITKHSVLIVPPSFGHFGSKYKNFAILQNLFNYPNGWLLLLHQKTAAAKAHPEKESRRRQLCTMASFFQENRSQPPILLLLLLLVRLQPFFQPLLAALLCAYSCEKRSFQIKEMEKYR